VAVEKNSRYRHSDATLSIRNLNTQPLYNKTLIAAIQRRPAMTSGTKQGVDSILNWIFSAIYKRTLHA
jgi:hypothetical protein